MPAKDEVALTLTLLDGQISHLLNPANNVAEISDVLDHLNYKGSDPEALDVIAQNATDLYDAVDNTRRLCKTALATARSLKTALDELKRGITQCDTDIPEIDALREMLEEDFLDSGWLSEVMYEEALDRIQMGSVLDYNEAAQLWGLLTDGQIDGDSPLWDELKDWMDRAERTTRRWSPG